MNVNLLAPTGANEFIGLSGTVYLADNNGLISVQPGDIVSAMNAGWRAGVQGIDNYGVAAPVAANTTGVFAGITLATASLSIVGQPDFGRKVAIRTALSAGTNTAGGVVLAGINMRGQTVTETISLVGAVGTQTLSSANPYAHVNSASIAGAVGGATGTLSGGYSADLGLPIPIGAVSLVVTKEDVDNANEAVGTVDATNGSVIPTTAPNGTHTYAFQYGYMSPAG